MPRTPAGPARVLILCSEAAGARSAGPAIRTWEFATTLAGSGHEVTVASLGRPRRESVGFRLVELTPDNAEALVDASDVVIFQGAFYATMPWLAGKPQVQVMDLYDPYHLELLSQLTGMPSSDAARRLGEVAHEISAQLARADLVLCASERQRDLWSGHLASLGRLLDTGGDVASEAPDMVRIVPFGVSDEDFRPTRSAIKGTVPGILRTDFLVLWAGGIYDWFDPLTLIEAVALAAPRDPRIKLFFLASTHPDSTHVPHDMVRRAQELADRLGVRDTHVFFNEDWVEFDDRGNYLGDADLGVTTHVPGWETRYSFRTRNLDYLWAGLPLVTTEGDVFGELAVTRAFGSVVPARNPAALADALVSAAEDPERLAAWSRSARAVGASMRWSEVLPPLIEFCRAPVRSGSYATATVGRANSSIGRDIRTAVAHLLRGGPTVLLERLRARRRRDGMRRAG